jgi:outer membrane lipoprotein-sorting protein
MRWEYGEPEKNIYVYKAGLLLSYFPEDNQLWRQRIPPEQSQMEIMDLLSGKGGWADRYIVEDNPFPDSAPGSVQLKLTPREEGDYAYFLLEIDGRGGLLRRAIFFDAGGNRTEFAFSRLKPGVRLADSTFEIAVPKDCEIIDDTASLKR